jgi:ABC-2 type transport system permease protein
MFSRILPLFTKSLADSWRSVLGWGAGLAAAMFLYLPLYPSIGGSQQMVDLIRALPPEMVKALNYDQIASGPGYAQATVFGLIGFLLMTIASVSWGAGAVGGDEETGQLELTLAHAVTRTQVVFERGLAIAVKIIALSGLVLVLLLLLNEPSQLHIDVGHAVGTVVLFAALAFLSGAMALLIGALSGRRVFGIAAGAGVAILGYLFNALGNQSTNLQWLHALSPYNWAYGGSPMANGADWGVAVGLIAVSVALTGLGALALQRRDVGI